jgi:hypothetical protein
MIKVTERENPVDMVTFTETARLFLNPLETTDWRIRRVIHDKAVACSEALPDGLCLMIFEAFRPESANGNFGVPSLPKSLRIILTGLKPKYTPKPHVGSLPRTDLVAAIKRVLPLT